MITFRQKGDFSKLNRYFEKLKEGIKIGDLDKYGRAGVEALSNANEHRGEKTLLEMFQEFKASGRSYGSWIIELEDRNKSSTKGSRGIKF